MNIPKEQWAAYLTTDYCVFTSQGVIRLRVGHKSLEVVRLHESFNVSSSAFVTAWNPFSEQTDDAVNQQNQEIFIAEIESKWECLPGEGADPTGEWPPEPSILVLGIDLQSALALGRKYKQNAILFTDDRGRTALHDCTENEQE